MKNLELVTISLFLATLAAACATAVPCGGTNCAPIGFYDGHQTCDVCGGVAAVSSPPPGGVPGGAGGGGGGTPVPPPPGGYGRGGGAGGGPGGTPIAPPLTERRGG
jgi:hypothetical protein